MKKATERALTAAHDKYQRALTGILTHEAMRAHIAGDVGAHKALGISVSFDLVQKEALAYSKEYGELLYREGATIIEGRKVPWLRKSTGRTREAIFKTINEGLKEGKPVAQIGGKRIAPGTIAHDLRKLVIRDKDYEYVRIARTEVGRIQNQGTLTRYDRNDVTEVDVLDDEGPNSCEACIIANGQRWTLDYARTHELEHPNCVRAFTPVIKR